MPDGTASRQQPTQSPVTRRCAICGGRFHTHWPRQCHCDPCWHAWDIRQCPDGREHEWVAPRYVTTDMGPLEGALIKSEECARCGVGSLSGISLKQYLAHRAWNDQRKGGR